MPKTIYMDYAAATPVDSEVVKAMLPYLADKFYNPSAVYLKARGVASDIAEARSVVAKWLGVRPSEIYFTAGGTEANNLAISGVMETFTGSNLIVSAVEHESVLKPAKKYDNKIASVQKDGRIDLKKLQKLIDDNTVLVSVMYANNEIGTIQPIKEISQMLEKIRKNRRTKNNKLPLYFHTDACQAAAYLDLHASRLGIDMMTINGGKIYGPKQSGILYVKTGVKLKPQILGGGQENGLRSGTENVASIIGLSQALDLVQTRRAEETAKITKLRDLFFELVGGDKLIINGSINNRLPSNIHITVPGIDNERLMMELDEQGIICAVGSACSASNEEPSHVLKAIGMTDKDARSSLRFSIGRETTIGDIRRAVKVMQQRILLLAKIS